MDTAAVELIGYLASGLIVLSLLMASVLRLRLINLSGSLVFTAYGLLINSLPVVIANGAIVLINLWHLRRLLLDRSRHASFEVLEVPTDSPLLHRFLSFHREEIARFQPDAPPSPTARHRALMILREALPVGVVLARPGEDGSVHIDLDYVVDKYRDLRPGSHLYDESGAFGDARLTATAQTRAHAHYLGRVGFHRDGDQWVHAATPAEV